MFNNTENSKNPDFRDRNVRKMSFFSKIFKLTSNISFNSLTCTIILLNMLILNNDNGILHSCFILKSEELEQSLCKSMKPCKHYATCKMDKNEFYPKCVCQDDCDIAEFRLALKTFAHESMLSYSVKGLFLKNLCGTDGEDYTNFCELRQNMCESQKFIGIYQFGKCGRRYFYFNFDC